MAKPKHALQAQNKLFLQSLSFSGPLPPPGAFEHYNAVLPGAAERILSMVESQTGHRQKIEIMAMKQNSRNSMFGTVFAFFLGVTGLIAGAYCILQGHDEAGATIGGASLVSLVSVFIYGTRSRRKEREEKARTMMQ
ncbi:MAG: DUF2335 domain-containing protein [Candidatus Latescibacter sp.]|nr:DUF2335 domain-containing protein [Candidatus Latescibacter sp.]